MNGVRSVHRPRAPHGGTPDLGPARGEDCPRRSHASFLMAPAGCVHSGAGVEPHGIAIASFR
jgi:hypothetical protein